MDLYGGGHKYVTDEKVNTDTWLGKKIGSANPQNATELCNLIGFKNQGSHLVTLRDNIPNNTDGILAGNYGSSIVFGGLTTAGVISLDPFQNKAKIIGINNINLSNCDDWSEDIAWKSDIQRLEQEISDLKKQIGGVNSHLYAYLRKALATSTEFMEVA